MYSIDEGRHNLKSQSALIDLQNACVAADTDKITERKKQIEKIKVELSKPLVIQALNYNSDNSRNDKKLLTWILLFQMVKRIFTKDLEALFATKARKKSHALKKPNQEALSLLKIVIKHASRPPVVRLKVAAILDVLIEMLEEEAICDMFGAEFTSIVLRDVLCYRLYWCQLDQARCHVLLSTYCHLLNASPVIIDRSITSKAIHTIVLNMAQHHDIKSDDLVSTLSTYYSKLLSADESLAILEQMICTTNVLCRAVASDRRLQMCNLGEEIFLPLLTIWRKKKPSDKLRDDLIEFYRLQMMIHHPNGAKKGSSSAFAVDWELSLIHI